MSDYGLLRVIIIWIRRLCVLGIWITIIKNQIPNSTTNTLNKVCRDTNVLKQYLKKGGNPDALLKSPDRFGRHYYPDNYPLLFCVSNEGAEILLKYGANPDIEADSQTPLYKALMFRNISLMELLLKHGANPDILTYDVTSVLHVAAGNGQEKIVELLLKNGADINIKDRFKATLLDVAIKRNQIEVAEILLANGGVTNTELGSKKLSHLRKKLNKRKLKRYHRRLRKIRQQQQSSPN